MLYFRKDLGRNPVYFWIKEGYVEDGALKQIINLANHPYVFDHIAVMPDVHQGYGMPIGTVAALHEAVSPHMVGYDVGCGMSAIKTNIFANALDVNTIKKIREDIKHVIPMGFNKYDKKQESLSVDSSTPIIQREYDNAMKSLGTLGGGNHFIEIQKDVYGFVWLMIHSGSRNVGKQVGEYYNALAKEKSKLPSNWQLDILDVNSEEGKRYLAEMKWCVNYAFVNRKIMMQKVQDVMFKYFSDIEFGDLINIAHNYAAKEVQYDTAVYVHRKGATSAFKDEIGIIPGSMGSKSYIVKGKGNQESYCSCSHGAGRTLGRNQAKKRLYLEIEQSILDDQGIIHDLRGVGSLDEAPSAYKDISEVMDNQAELVDIVVELTPITTIKDVSKKRKR